MYSAMGKECYNPFQSSSATMKTDSQLSTQALVFFLVGSAFTTVYITQPVLPVIENEFAVDARTASLSVAMVIFGIAAANLPLRDARRPISDQTAHSCRRHGCCDHEPGLRDNR